MLIALILIICRNPAPLHQLINCLEINLEFSRYLNYHFGLRSSPAEQMNLTIVLALFQPL